MFFINKNDRRQGLLKRKTDMFSQVRHFFGPKFRSLESSDPPRTRGSSEDSMRRAVIHLRKKIKKDQEFFHLLIYR